MGIKGRVTWQQEWVRITQYKCHANSMWYWPANMIFKPIEYSSSTTLPPHTPHTPTHHPHNTAQHTTSLHNTPSTISILPPILRGGSHNHTLLRFLPSTLSLPTIMSPHTDSHHKETRMDRKREASPASWTPLDKKEVFHPNTN